ncbi:MAG: hypothetical protein H7Y38_00425 [Armatimonadetes bacterium]|nr:hypothetical protein [Armatimonadota bacterium]
MKRIAIFAAAVIAFVGLAPRAHAQDINVNGSLGNLYQNLYTSTHMFGGAGGGGTTRPTRRKSAPARWRNSPKTSAEIKRIVAAVPAANRAATRTVLEQVLAGYPKIVRAASQQSGVSLSATDPRDAGALAGTLSYEILTGKELTNTQFAANRALSRRLFGNGYVSASNMQESGETYALAAGLMVSLQAWADNPKNPDPELTRQQLRGLAQDTFRIGYRDADYTKFAPTSSGLKKVN